MCTTFVLSSTVVVLCLVATSSTLPVPYLPLLFQKCQARPGKASHSHIVHLNIRTYPFSTTGTRVPSMSSSKKQRYTCTVPVKLNTEFSINQVYGTNTWVCRVMCILYTFTTITMNSPLSSYKTILFHWSFPRRLFRFRIVVITFALVVLMFRPPIGQFFFQFFSHDRLTHNGCGIF